MTYVDHLPVIGKTSSKCLRLGWYSKHYQYLTFYTTTLPYFCPFFLADCLNAVAQSVTRTIVLWLYDYPTRLSGQICFLPLWDSWRRINRSLVLIFGEESYHKIRNERIWRSAMVSWPSPLDFGDGRHIFWIFVPPDLLKLKKKKDILSFSNVARAIVLPTYIAQLSSSSHLVAWHPL